MNVNGVTTVITPEMIRVPAGVSVTDTMLKLVDKARDAVSH